MSLLNMITHRLVKETNLFSQTKRHHLPLTLLSLNKYLIKVAVKMRVDQVDCHSKVRDKLKAEIPKH